MSQFYRNTKAVIFAFDITNIESLQKLEFWNSDITKQLGSDFIKVVIATRCDLKNKKFEESGKPIKIIPQDKIDKFLK